MTTILVYLCISGVFIVRGHQQHETKLKELQQTVNKLQYSQSIINGMKHTSSNILLPRIQSHKDAVNNSANEGDMPDSYWDVLFQRLEQLEIKTSILEKHVHSEGKMDLFLQQLPSDFKAEIASEISKMKKMAEKMKNMLNSSLNPLDTLLSKVDSASKSRNLAIGGVLYLEGIGSACRIRSDVCRVVASECRDDVCQCLPGLSYDSLHQACVENCTVYGNTYQTVSNRIIRGFNNEAINNISLSECKKSCQNAKRFQCTSLDYFHNWKSCYLSEFRKKEAAADAWEYNAAAVHFQRDCAF